MTLNSRALFKTIQTFCLANTLLLAVSGFSAAQTWPAITLPEDVVSTPVGEQITQNGWPMRLQAFVTKQSATELTAWFRKSFGRRRVEDKLDNAIVIGRAEGDFYLSVKITPTVNGARGIAAVSRIKTIGEAFARGETLLTVAPGNSEVLSDTSSQDAGKVARHLVYTNRHTQETNRELVSAFLKNKGYKLEREVKLENQQGQTLFFRDSDSEAIAVITSLGDKTAVVVNTASHRK